ncbi:MAG: class I SAM-dependent methyltransferase [archaeon]|nr:class I SAM-dependent methyltransferase [archaeon]
MHKNRFHGKAGKDYDLVRQAFPQFDEFEKAMVKTIKKQFKNSSIRKIKIIEIGCGHGHTTFALLDSDKRVRVTAIDNEPIMIKQAKKNLKKFIKNHRVNLVKDDALKFLKKQKSNSFDIFASDSTLHNFPKSMRRKTIEEIYRVLKFGGIFVNVDKYAHDDESEHKKYFDLRLKQFREEFTKINRPDLAEEWIKHNTQDNKSNIIMKQGESIKDMKKIGFKEPRIVVRKEMDAVMFAFK